jgi:DNA-binding LacI/PurR family transcriptional regulator
MRDIAEECGVSLSTVSLVLSKNARISKATSERVKAAIKRVGYQPDIRARGLALRTSHTLSVVVPAINNLFADVYFGQIVSGIYECAAEKNYKILLDMANDRFIETGEHLNLLRAHRADGMLFVCASLFDNFLRDFERESYPFLLVNHYFPDKVLNFVATDYVDTARQAAAHLLGLGHRRVGLISGTNVQTALDFQEAFQAAFAEAGVPGELPWADGDFRGEGGYAAAQTLWKDHPDLTAVMAGNDKMALGALRFFKEAGVAVPETVSVMGVDDMPGAAFASPGLTTIRHDLYELGRVACNRLLNLGRGKATECHELLPVSLVVRESTAPPRV